MFAGERRMTRRGFIVRCAAVLALTDVSFGADDRVASPDLWKVSKVYVGEMGQSDEAARFRMLLEEELSKAKFGVVGKMEDADASLTGVLSLRIFADESVARATVVLKGSTGARLWGGDFEPRSALFKKIEDVVRFRAQNIAGDLRKDWNRSAKKAGQREVK